MYELNFTLEPKDSFNLIFLAFFERISAVRTLK